MLKTYRLCLLSLTFVSTIIILAVRRTVPLLRTGHRSVEFSTTKTTTATTTSPLSPTQTTSTTTMPTTSTTTDVSPHNTILQNTISKELNAFRAVILSNIMKDMDEARPRYKFLLEPKVIVSVTYEGGWTSVVLVKSARSNSDRRDAIRETWASVHTYNGCRFITVFIIGKPDGVDSMNDRILAEQDKNGDILMADFTDTAKHVPDKALAGMQWAADTLPDHWIYSTADDDISLHVPNFARYINDTIMKYSGTQPTLRNFVSDLPIMCVYSYQKKDPPARNPNSKWYMPMDQYPEDNWPPYCRGGWYSMTVGFAGEIFKISRWMVHLHLDDVWITGLMRIKYSATVSKDEPSVLDSFLDAAPLSRRSDGELGQNLKEEISEVIVSHAWGNIAGKKVDVPQVLRNNWKKWSDTFLRN